MTDERNVLVPQKSDEDIFMLCAYGDCKRRRYCNGFCTAHYKRNRDGQPMDGPMRAYHPRHPDGINSGKCRVAGCGNNSKATGLCHTHYEMKRKQDPNWNRILKRRRAGVVNLGSVYVVKQVANALTQEAKAKGIKRHELVGEILELWERARRNDARFQDAIKAEVWLQRDGFKFGGDQ